MTTPFPTIQRLVALPVAATFLVSMPAWAEQQAPVYNPPPFIIIAPSTGENPYLMYVPLPQAEPLQPVQAPSASRPATPTSDADKPPAGRSLSDLGKSLRNYFTEDELDLLFEYMKESVVASFKGEEVHLPPDLAFKLEVLLVRLQKEGSRYMENLIQQLERDLKQSLKEKLVPPVPAPGAPPALPQTTPSSNPVTPSAPPPSGSSKLPAKRTAKNT
jgi:hypothetical protein